jgi:hypothetical protein
MYISFIDEYTKFIDSYDSNVDNNGNKKTKLYLKKIIIDSKKKDYIRLNKEYINHKINYDSIMKQFN